MSDGYELEELTRIEAALDALVSPTSEDVFQATRPFDERAIASVAATRAGSVGGGAQTFITASVTLTNAQVKALPTTPVTVVAAPGVGKVIVPLQGILHLRNWVADYTNINSNTHIKLDTSGSFLGGDLLNSLGNWVSQLLAGGGPDGTWAMFPPAGLALDHGGTDADSLQFVGDAGFYDADVANRAVVLSCPSNNGGAGDFTGGDDAQTLVATVTYQLLDL